MPRPKGLRLGGGRIETARGISDKQVADLRFKVRGFSFGITPSGSNLHAHIEFEARPRLSVRSFLASNAHMHFEGQRNAIDAQSADPLLVLAADPREFQHARPLPILSMLYRSPAYWV